MEQYLSDQNQLHIFNNDNFLIIPKSNFSDNNNLPISCKNAEISAVHNFFDNIAHPYPSPKFLSDPGPIIVYACHSLTIWLKASMMTILKIVNMVTMIIIATMMTILTI